MGQKNLSTFSAAAITIIGILACAVGAYAFAQRLYTRSDLARSISMADMCEDVSPGATAEAPVQNPSATLFINCGGFVE